MFVREVQKWLENLTEFGLRDEILSWMKTLESLHDYRSVLLADIDGNVRLSVGEEKHIDGDLLSLLSQVTLLKTPTLSPLYKSKINGDIGLCLFAPVFNSQDNDAPAVGVLLLIIDPYEFLYPLIQSWPTPSQTSETLLVRREGDEVLYLNELRHWKGTALSLRLPMSGYNLPSARAVQWEEGVVEGVDYRGALVLASIRSIPNSPWFVVAKADAEEVYARIRERVRGIAAMVGILICGTAVTLAYIWSRNEQKNLQTARNEMEQRVKERTAELARANESLHLDESRLEALLELSQMSNASTKDIMDFANDQLVRLTQSKVGALGFLNENETLFTRHAWSSEVIGHCGVLGEERMHFPIETAGMWAEAVRRRKPIVVNDYAASELHKNGHPAGHIEIHRLMSIPVFNGDSIVALAMVANKDEYYDASDLRQITLLMDGMWKLIQRQRAEKTLRETESLTAMGKALSSVAHDLKTPLIAIGGFTHIVYRHLEESNPDRAKLEIVIKETQRLESMVKDMLDFTRHLELERNAYDINQLVRESIAVVEAVSRERKVKIQTELTECLPLVSFDAMRMKQVIINLVMNAVQASLEGESLKVYTHQKQGKLLIDIIDRGCGIPPENRKEVFLPFVSTKKEGTGLGLAIVKKITEAHQGCVEILDNIDKGVTFRVVLPAGI
jgi:signal transduction histidine kinase